MSLDGYTRPWGSRKVVEGDAVDPLRSPDGSMSTEQLAPTCSSLNAPEALILMPGPEPTGG